MSGTTADSNDFQAQENVRRFVASVEALARQGLAPQAFYQEYFRLIFSLGSVRVAAVSARHGKVLSRAFAANEEMLGAAASQKQNVFIQELCNQVLGTKSPVLVQPGSGLPGREELANECGLTVAAFPVIFGDARDPEALQGVQLIGFEPLGDPGLAAQFAGLLELVTSASAAVLRATRLDSVAKFSTQIGALSALLSEIVGEMELRGLASTVVNRSREILGCDRCALLTTRNGTSFSLVAISNTDIPDTRSAIVRSMVQLSEDSVRHGGPCLFQKSTDRSETVGTLADFFYYSRSVEVLAVPVKSRAGVLVGMLLADSAVPGTFGSEKQEMGNGIAAQTGPAIAAALEYEGIPLLSRLRAFAAWMRKPWGSRRRDLMVRLGVPLLVAAGIAFFPIPFNLAGDCRLFPLERAAAISETGGRLVEVLVKDGDAVAAGAPLARTDDEPIRKELDVLAQELARYEAEGGYRLAQDDRIGAQLSELQKRRASRQIELTREQLERTVIRSPLPGVVMHPGPLPKVGEVLPFGGALCSVGATDRWEATVYLKERDVMLMAKKLSAGPLPVRITLQAMPGEAIRSEVPGKDAIAQMSEMLGTLNVFPIRFDLGIDRATAGRLRAGYSGRGKVRIGQRPLAYVLTRNFFIWWRTRWV